MCYSEKNAAPKYIDKIKIMDYSFNQMSAGKLRVR